MVLFLITVFFTLVRRRTCPAQSGYLMNAHPAEAASDLLGPVPLHTRITALQQSAHHQSPRSPTLQTRKRKPRPCGLVVPAPAAFTAAAWPAAACAGGGSTRPRPPRSAPATVITGR